MVDASESLDYAGQVIVDGAVIVTTNGMSFNVVGQLVSIELFEHLYQPFMTGTLMLYESRDLINLFPLVGEEMLQLSFHTPKAHKKHERNRQFYIYKMTDMAASSDRSNIYVLHFISIDAVVNINTKLSRAFEGRVSDIATKIIKDKYALNTKEQVNVEDSHSITKFVANYWSPMKCIDYLTRTATNANGSSSFIFFENSQGFNFIALDSLYAAPAVFEFKELNVIRPFSESGTANRDVKLDYMKIISYSIPFGFDYLDRCHGGMYGSQLITVDPVMKKYSSTVYDGNTNFSKLKHLNDFSMISNKAIAGPNQLLLYVSKHYGNFNGYLDVTDASVIQQRTSLLKMSDAFRINITVLGRTEYTVGQKVFVSILAKQAVSSSTEISTTLDKTSTGYYLISAIAHRITMHDHKHECDMELIKDTFKDLNINKGSNKK